jgi:hypothetical protein
MKTLLPGPNFLASRDYAERAGAQWRIAYRAHPLRLVSPRKFGPLTLNLAERLPRMIPEVGVLAGERLFLVGADGTVCTQEGTILADHSWFRGYTQQMPSPGTGHRVQYLSGSTLTLASDWSANNYSHFLLDSLPRLGVVERLGYRLREFDHVVISQPNDHCRALTEKLGIDRKQIVEPKAGVALAPQFLVAPSFPGVRRNVERWAAEFLHQRLSLAPGSPRRRLYVPRLTRRPVNQEVLEDILRPYGFETYFPEREPAMQLQVFSQADIVIGAHGAALANVTFCPAGTDVLEIIPTDHAYPYFYTACTNLDLGYAYLGAQSLCRRYDSEAGPSPFDFYVDEEDFAAAVECLVCERQEGGRQVFHDANGLVAADAASSSLNQHGSEQL